ncbi:MAG: HD domain-containing protein [Eubacteriales bacterium]|nr:HD domain-containing protein [Eubacteriales bacterium]
MDREQLLDIARREMAQQVSHQEREPGWVLRHGSGTARLALELRKALLPADGDIDDTLYAAALFHDCGKYADAHQAHAQAGSQRARQLLAGVVQAQELDVICHAILVHDKRKAQPYTQLEYLLQDADILDHMGSIEIWLNFNYSARTGRDAAFSAEFYESREFRDMTDMNRSLLNYSQSVIAFQEKLEFALLFAERFRRECDGRLDYLVAHRQ